MIGVLQFIGKAIMAALEAHVRDNKTCTVNLHITFDARKVSDKQWWIGMARLGAESYETKSEHLRN